MTKKTIQSTFKWLNITQFFGALNDNLYKLSMAFFLIAANPDIAPDTIMACVGAVFVLPFLLFSDAAGALADRISKQTIIVRLKMLEVILMGSGLIFFYMENSTGLYLVLFAMCTQSAFFGPAKYGIIPELVSEEKLSKANSYFISATFISIIIGTLMASLFAGGEKGFVYCGMVCAVISLVGCGASVKIYKTPSKEGRRDVSIFFFIGIWKTMKSISGHRDLLIAVLISSYFWFSAAFAQMNLVPYGMDLMNLTSENSNIAGCLYLFAAFGVGSGALLAGWLSGSEVELGIVPLGAFGLAVSLVGLNFAAHTFIWAMVLIYFFGISAGLFILPLNAFIQWKTPEKICGSVLAATNFLNFTGILCASLMIKVLHGFNLSSGKAFMVTGSITFIFALGSIILLKDFFISFTKGAFDRSIKTLKG